MRTLLLGVCLLLASAALSAADLAPCLSCHGGGERASLAPNLDGQHDEYLDTQLRRFRDHVRESFPMQGLAQGLDDGVISGIAAAFASRPWFDHQGRLDGQRVARGAALAVQRDCAACHGEAMRGGGSIPRLAGQSPLYLARQIAAFGDADRFHPPTGDGGRMYQLDAAEAQDLAAWLASLR